MSNSIIGKLFLWEEEKAKQTIQCLRKLGLGCDKFKQKDIDYTVLEIIYIIEFKEKPFILKTLEYNNFFDEKNYIYINSVSEEGICFYVVGQEFSDGSIFVPMDNITCIHTIKKDQVLHKLKNLKSKENVIDNLTISVKELIKEIKHIDEIECCLERDDNTFEYKNRERVRLSSKLRDLMLKSQLPKEDFLVIIKAFSVTTDLNEQLDTVRFFDDEED